MPKRKHKDKKQEILRKIRRLERRLDSWSSNDSSDEDRAYEEDRNRYYSGPRTPVSDIEAPALPLSDSEISMHDDGATSTPKSVVVVANTSDQIPTQEPVMEPSTSKELTNAVTPGSSGTSCLPIEILEALGDPKGKEEVFGPDILEEISERWGRVLTNGMMKELKQKLSEKYLIPSNFRLAKAPLLNPELIPVLSETAKHRDKLMEKSQNQLGIGIAQLTYVTTKLIGQENINKIEILKDLSEISQIFLDLHHEDTKRRRKLITASLDKKFSQMVSEVKRDGFLFGTNLGEKIRASKTAERSGLQIKRVDQTPPSRRNPQGNWKGPPRGQTQRAHRPGGPRNQYATQTSRRHPPTISHPPRTAGKAPKAQKP